MFPCHVIILVALLMSLPVTGLASSREFIENYTHNAGESDSKLTCRMVSLIEIKGLFDAAITDLTEVLRVQPNMRGALFHRGMAYNRSGNKGYGRRDMEKAAELGNNRAKKWLEVNSSGYGSGKRKARLP